jgi:hypothetical protein
VSQRQQHHTDGQRLSATVVGNPRSIFVVFWFFLILVPTPFIGENDVEHQPWESALTSA